MRPYWKPNPEILSMVTERSGAFLYEEMHRWRRFYILQDVKRLCRSQELALCWPEKDEINWEAPHLGYLAAAELGYGAEFLWAVYLERWQKGADISDPDILAGVCREVGVPVEPVLAAADEPSWQARGVDALVHAYENQVFGIPFMTCGWERFWGQDRVEEFCSHVDAR